MGAGTCTFGGGALHSLFYFAVSAIDQPLVEESSGARNNPARGIRQAVDVPAVSPLSGLTGSDTDIRFRPGLTRRRY